ncbi:hypothetical protein [Effusibacillus dendaii]|uniref:Uncharacterized protein n=1 Tax=Effusibacillus dendaii TaxID=2743772 RepID=A0A7I8D4V2_9BACL|nr:hypothetical protein [Effusibacillus dendaii]BCJ85087.1 hypothetical protein skT53_00720 [Effusibacillus dendaii]
MWTYLMIAVASGLIEYFALSTFRIYRDIINDFLPELASQSEQPVQADLIQILLTNRFWRLTMVLPVAFLCTFILFPYDLLKGLYWLQAQIGKLFF